MLKKTVLLFIICLCLPILCYADTGDYLLDSLYFGTKFDYVSPSGSADISKYSVIGDKYLDISVENDLYNQTVQKTLVFNELDVAAQEADPLTIVSINVTPDWIYLEQEITINMEFNKELQYWFIKIDNITPNFTYYEDKHLYIIYRPASIGEQSLLIDSSLKASGEDTIVNLAASFNLVVDSGEKKISVALNKLKFNEVQVGKSTEKALDISLQAKNWEQYLDNLDLIINLKNGSPITKLSLLDVSSNLVIAETQTIIYNSPLTFSLITQNSVILSQNIEKKLLVRYDISATAQADSTFNIQMDFLSSHKITGNQKQIITTTSIYSNDMVIVAKDKPVIYDLSIPQFSSAPDNVNLNLIHSILQGNVSNLKFRLFNVENSQYTNWNMIAYQYETIPSTDYLYKMTNNQLTGLNLTHNYHYFLEAQLIGQVEGSVLSTNLMTVDLTPPLIPNKLIVNSTQINSKSDTIPLQLIMDVSDSLDPESGLSMYRIARKSALEPNWTIISSGNIISFNGQIINIQERNNNLYNYKLAVQNKAGAWSDYSEETELDLRNTDMLDVLFNSPNPFDSRIQSTKIYYSLPDEANVDLAIYDMFGYLVKKWQFVAGTLGGMKNNQLEWDGTNMYGFKVSKGGYVLLLKATDRSGKTIEKKYKIGVIH
ncbi:MAG: hypothetical protein PHV30_06760 [Candidatus Margulisbacteria bacterium]|nr:hypothetical protein [Candidatus Margulisiibacteriota bacterium]